MLIEGENYCLICINKKNNNIEVFRVGFSEDDKKSVPLKIINLPKENENFSYKLKLDVTGNWSADCYLALHFGWPYDIAEKNSGRFNHSSVDYYYNRFKNTSERLTNLCGKKPMTTAEFNTDGDVTGSFNQGESIIRFARKFCDNEATWFDGISLYQFRDRGRLGLELEDPNNKSVGIEIPIIFEKTPEFCEITIEEKLSLMIEINGRWFYKSPEVKTIDLLPAFYKNRFNDKKEISVKIFATPLNGENFDNGNDDWNFNYYAEMKNPPKFRIRYEVPSQVE